MSRAESENSPLEAENNPPPSLKSRAISGSAWTLAGECTQYVLRLGGNLVLTRLLFPEAFGLMSLVQVFIMGLEMFSDVGIIPGIIQNKRGDEPAFLNTAWTIQVGRGIMLWIFACVIAVPASQFYREPMLMQLLPISGLTALIAGFNSTKLATENRKLSVGRLTLLDLGSYVLGLTVMVVWAWIFPSVWSLVGGGIVAALAKMILSHVYLKGERNYFHWDKEAFRSLQQFGRWIFLSTVLTFFAGQGDRIVIGRLLDVKALGIYTVAITMARLVNETIMKLGSKVLFPSYSELIRERPEQLYVTLRKTRLFLIAGSWVASLFLMAFGETLISFLYDDRYAKAGWMLKVLPINALIGVLIFTYDDALMAMGKTFTMTSLLAVQVAVELTAMVVGGYIWGENGVIIGISCFAWVLYPLKAIFFARLSIWQPEVDLPIIALATSVVGSLYFFNFFS
ncbi:MAG: oligosaccharide flippase family protein [Drouetiella hepatica Uher 2000/2452]|jgi:O-antigen/teichoic acid export membrane protein|uniref:Oligosaccharide flippase family protein n=1 Tax=Drouetiella hepatica Uher 2000/2452 TaxID=904376 RepID=A0A951UPL4_9CYAN|nr:oligosaccharide flippase family protein [Drouetiella hepatica Uher 2000/2452]